MKTVLFLVVLVIVAFALIWFARRILAKRKWR